MVDLEIREIKESELLLWDKFVEDSEQGTLFPTSLWLEILNEYPYVKFAEFRNLKLKW